MGRYTCGVMDERTSPYKCGDSDSSSPRGRGGEICGEGETRRPQEHRLSSHQSEQLAHEQHTEQLAQRQSQERLQERLSSTQQEQLSNEQRKEQLIQFQSQERLLERVSSHQPEQLSHEQHKEQREFEELLHRQNQQQVEYYQEQFEQQQRHQQLMRQQGHVEDRGTVEPMADWTTRRSSTATAAELSGMRTDRRRYSPATLEDTASKFIAGSSLERKSTTVEDFAGQMTRKSTSPKDERPLKISPTREHQLSWSMEFTRSPKVKLEEPLDCGTHFKFDLSRNPVQHSYQPSSYMRTECVRSSPEQYSAVTYPGVSAGITFTGRRRPGDRGFDEGSRVYTCDTGSRVAASETRLDEPGDRLRYISPEMVKEALSLSHQDSESQSYDSRSRKYIHRLPLGQDPRWRSLSEKDAAMLSSSSGRILEGHRVAQVPVVPNIIIEHAPGAMHYSHSLTPPFSHSRQSGPRWPSGAGGAWSEAGTSQKVRAYSDSAMYDSDRHALGIAESPIEPTNRSSSQGMESERRIFVFEPQSGPHVEQPDRSSYFIDIRKSIEAQQVYGRGDIIKMEEETIVPVEGHRRVPHKVSSADVDVSEGRREFRAGGTQVEAWNLSPGGSRPLVEESPTRVSTWLRRSSDSSVRLEETLVTPVVGDQSKQLSVSDTKIVTIKKDPSEETAASEPLRTSTSSSTVTSPFEAGKDSSTSFSHCKVKKYLQTRWFESRQSQSPDTSEAGRTSTESVEKDDVFAEPSPRLMEMSPVGVLPSSAADDNLSPSSFHSAESQMLAEVSPSAYMEATRIYDDSESPDLKVKTVWESQERPRHTGESLRWLPSETQRQQESDIRQYFIRKDSDDLMHRPPVSSSQVLTYHPGRTQHTVFTFPGSVDPEAPASNPFTKSFSALSPLVQDPRSGGPVTSPPSRLIPSPHGIRKYSSQGSSVNPLVMVSRSYPVEEPPLRFFHEPLQPKTEFPHRSSDVPSSLRYMTSQQHFSKSLQKSLSPIPVESERPHVPARRIQSMGSYYDTLVTAAIASAPPSPIVSDIPMSPPFSRQLIQRGSTGGRHLLSSPFLPRQQRQEPRLSTGYDPSITSSSSSSQSSSSRSSTSSHCYVCPVCGIPLTSYSSLASHMSIHVPTEVPQAARSGQAGEEAAGAVVAGSGAPGGGEAASNLHLCRVCNRSFSRSDMLSRHMRLHTGLRPYECDLCGQVFSRSDHLHTHQRTHTGEKPYHCKFCVYAAPRRDMVTRHMRVHMRESSGPRRGRRSHSASSFRATHASRGRGMEVESGSPRTLSSSSSSSSRGFSSTASSRRHLSDVSVSRGMGGASSSLDPITGRVLEGRGGGRARNWSLTSSAASSDVGSELSPLPPPSSGRGLSSSRTLSEGSEMYPSPGYAGPSPAIWSPCTDSPAEVFTPSVRHQVRHFIWPTVPLPAPTSVRDDSGMETEDSKMEELPEREEKSHHVDDFGNRSGSIPSSMMTSSMSQSGKRDRKTCKNNDDDDNKDDEGRRRIESSGESIGGKNVTMTE